MPGSSRSAPRQSGLFGQTAAHSSWQAMESETMFQTLDEQIEKTEGDRSTTSVWLVRFVEIAVVLVCLFGGLYFAIVSFQ